MFSIKWTERGQAYQNILTVKTIDVAFPWKLFVAEPEHSQHERFNDYISILPYFKHLI
jgi:hypothetical protein